MTASAEPRDGFLAGALRALLPFPGRAAMTWRIALVCALTSMTAMVYGIPEAAISCYLIFFVMKPDGTESAVLAVALCVLASLVVVLLVFLARWTIAVPALRLLTLTVSSLILLYLGSASKLGPLGGIVALVLAFAMTLLSDVPFGEAATRGILYAWLMAAMPMGWVLFGSLSFGRRASTLVRSEVSERLEIAAHHLESGTPVDPDDFQARVGQGQMESFKRWTMVRTFALAPRDETRQLGIALQESSRLLCALATLEAETSAVDRQAMVTQARAAARSILAGQPVPPMPPAPGLSFTSAQAWIALWKLSDGHLGTPVNQVSEPFMSRDAVSNPEHLRYAIKTTAAAVICYLIYTALDWQGIHTAMITCYVAALGSVAETAHKLLLRIVGCLIGAAMGIGSILFLIPHMTSVGSLILLVFGGTFVAAWVAVGSERVSYAGVQIALAFLMTVLQGFGPSIDMEVARDRVIGILLGNVVLYFIFVQCWPVSVGQRVSRDFSGALALLARMTRQPSGEDKVMEAAAAIEKLGQARDALELFSFEPRRERLTGSQVNRLSEMGRSLLDLCVHLVFEGKRSAVESTRLDELASRMTDYRPRRGEGTPESAWSMAQGGASVDKIDRLEELVNGR